MVVYTYNPSTQEAEPGELVSSRPAWAAQQGPVSNPTIPQKTVLMFLTPNLTEWRLFNLSLLGWEGLEMGGEGTGSGGAHL